MNKEDLILKELRKRANQLLITFALIFFASVYFSKTILRSIIIQRLESLDIKLIAVSPLESLLLFFQASVIISLGLTFPFFLYHTLRFIAPALTQREKGPLYFLLFSSLMLFLAGMLFSYFLSFQIFLPYLEYFSRSIGITNLWSIDQFIKFLLLTVVVFGGLFQIPLVTLGLIKMEIVDRASLHQYRKHIIVGSLIVAAFITPPDVISQIIVAATMLGLFELSLIFSRFIPKIKERTK